MIVPVLPRRDNLVHRQSESSRPPVFQHGRGIRASLTAVARRFLDLQAARVVGVLCLPLLFCLAMIGQISLRSRGGNDCLGYTAIVSLAHTSAGIL